jgi:hypothetical protein
VIVGAVDGTAEIARRDVDAIMFGLLGIMVAIGLWWIYFDLVSHRAPVSKMTQLSLYPPPPLGHRDRGGRRGRSQHHRARHRGRAPCGALAPGRVARSRRRLGRRDARTLETRRRHEEIYRAAEAALVLSGLLCIAVALTDWGAKASLTAMVLLLLAPVAAGLVVWLKHSDPDVIDRD